MSTEASTALKQAVQLRGTRPFLLRQTVGDGIFNLAFSSGSGSYEAWSSELTNAENNELVAG